MQMHKDTFEFLRQLAANNNKEWFDANRPWYQEIRESLVDFTREFIEVVKTVDPSVEGLEPKDCIFRINRDIRFSKDKSPYKTYLSCAVARGGRSSTWPGYYFSFEPGMSMFGGGCYCLEKDELAKVRREIVNFPEDMIAAVENDEFRKRARMFDEMKLKTFPKGYETGFRGDEYLKYKGFASQIMLSDDECLSDSLIDRLASDIKVIRPLNDFLAQALDAPEEERVEW